MFTKLVDGKNIVCSEKEETEIRAFWDLNRRYPEYKDAIRYDGASMPTIDMERATELHAAHVKKWQDSKITELSTKIDIARDNGDLEGETSLRALRKAARNFQSDHSKATNLDDLKALLPT